MENDRHPAERLRLVDIIMSHFQNTIFEDKGLFDKAGADKLVPYFRLWLADIERSPSASSAYGYSNFMVIDEESLQTITAAPDAPPPNEWSTDPEATVQIVQASSRRTASEGTMGLWEEYHNGTDSHD